MQSIVHKIERFIYNVDNIYTMAYIDKVKSGNKTFYYLGKTLRIGTNKWKKIRIRLGTEKPSKDVIAKKLKELMLEQYGIYNKDFIDANKLEVIDDFK